MKLSVSTLEKIIEDLKGKIVNNYISNVSVIGGNDFLISFSKYREKRLYVSLSHQLPFCALVDIDASFPTTQGRLNETIRKEIKDGLLTDCCVLNGDRIVAFQIVKTNDLFEKTTKTLILELIPTKPNLIILDADGKVVFAYRENSLEKSRPLMRGLNYEPPLKKDTFKVGIGDESISVFEEVAIEKILEAQHKQIKQQFTILFHYLKNRSKRLLNKVNILIKEIEEAKKELAYLEHGNTLLSLDGNIDEVILYVNENNISYDDKLSVGANANRFFKKYKKAKKTIQMDESEILKSQHEGLRIESLLGQSQYMTESELSELANKEIPHLLKSANHKKSLQKPSISFIFFGKDKIFFGKNAKQNDYITFKMSQPNHWFFHIKDYPGSHVVIASQEPNDEEMLLAAEMCLVLSNQTIGEVQYGQIKDVKKTSNVGQVIMNKYQVLNIKNISKQTLDLLDNYHKMII